MTDLGVNICTVVSFGNETFTIPDTLNINPISILDDRESVYRVSIQKFTEPKDEKTDKAYEALFTALDKHMPFVDNIHFRVSDAKLTFTLALVTRYRKSFGIFYDIEASLNDIEYKEREITYAI